jgi:F0F1-type ATP synthase epsilon subunit
MAPAGLHFVVLTPHALMAELDVVSLRLPADTGQVGLRPRGEATVLAVEPGLVLAQTATELRFLATAGGLLRADGRQATLLTPLAVLGDDGPGVLAALATALAMPDPERDLRLAIERLQTGILQELRRPDHRGGASGGPG